MTRFLSILTLALALAACGGAVNDGDNGSQPGAAGGQAGNAAGRSGAPGAHAGSPGAGGTGAGGASNGSCEWGGVIFADGEFIPAGDCNACFCDNGQVACTTIVCPASCEDVSAASAAALEEAKACNPQQADSCSQVVAGALDCGCSTYVNPENENAIAALAAAQGQVAMFCGVPACDCATPSGATCSPEGQCVDLWEEDTLAACQVNGEIYPSGSSGFAGPLGCNTCSCDDGQLICTEAACPSACPPNSVEGSHCAQCGPADECTVVEYTCLEVCTDGCEEGACLDGVCKNVCG